jgi:hypothetical protein
MRYDEIQAYFNHHCRIKLRSGKEVFGVLWSDLNDAERAIYFASYMEHKKMLAQKRLQARPRQGDFSRLATDDILGIEPLKDDA